MTLSRARSKLLAGLRSRKSREREGLFLVEGVRSAGEALDARTEIRFGVVAPRVLELAGGARLVERLEAAGLEIHHVDDAELAGLSDTQAPQGVLLVCREPTVALQDLAGDPLRLLVLDGVQDPGNAGTLVRAAAAFALQGVVTLDGSVDPFNPKVVRACAGALFRVPVLRAAWSDLLPWLRGRGVRLLIADAAGADVGGADASPPWALVVGSEAAGVREEVAAEATQVVGIPMPGGTDSLNAAMAGAILLYVLRRGGGRG